MRIISGKYKGRKLETLTGKQLRPTMGVAREAIFNILSHGEFGVEGFLDGCRVLDLFCGCGALAAEALSRGAEKAVLIDINQNHLDTARHNIRHMGEEANSIFIRADSSNPPPARVTCNLIFIDPPYKESLVNNTLQNLVKSNWLENQAIVVIETWKKEDIVMPEGFTEVHDRHYGNCRIRLLRWHKAHGS